MPYRSSYGYRGDPFLGDVLKGVGKFVGGVAKTAVGVAGSVLPGPLGGVARLVSGAGARPQILPPAPGMAMPGGGYTMRAVPGVTSAMGVGGQCPKGYRLNKSGYYTQAGYVAPYSKCVRIRRQNPANSRALSKALRREENFVRLARRSGLVALPKAKRLRRATRKRR